MKINQNSQNTLRQWVNFIAILAAFGTNIWANIAPLKGLTLGEISNTFFSNVLIIPASYAFAIWGIIYLGLIALAIYQLLPTQKNNARLCQMGYYLAISSVCQIIWVFLFQSQLFALSVIAMLGILIPLILLYLRLDINLTKLSSPQRWLVNFPISTYFAWISVATIINIASTLEVAGWSGWGISSLVWTVIMLIIATIIGIIVTWQRRDSVFGGVFVWALAAIAQRHFVIASEQGQNPTMVIITGLLAVLVLLTITIRGRFESKRKRA